MLPNSGPPPALKTHPAQTDLNRATPDSRSSKLKSLEFHPRRLLFPRGEISTDEGKLPNFSTQGDSCCVNLSHLMIIMTAMIITIIYISIYIYIYIYI